MKTPFPRLFALGLGAIILLGACSPPAASTPEPTVEAPQQSQPSDLIAPEDAAPVDESAARLGTWMNWFDGNILLYVPEGEFQMGAREFDDNPPRSVALGSYWIYRFPVTNDMYRQCVAAGACDDPATEPPYEDSFDPKRADHPVVGVNWEQAQTYCGWMSAELPTEAQWEKAARGPDGNTYPWGEDDPDCSLLNYQGCRADTTPVLAYYPDGRSYYELLDTAGNTFEWTRDWYQEDYYKTAPDTNPPGPDTGSFRSVRGSGFDSELDLLPLAHRAYLQPEKYRVDLGFRCVVTEPVKYAPYCEQIAYIPGENKGPGSPPPGGPDVILHQIPDCQAPDPDFNVGNYCYDQTNQLGGASVTYTGDLQSVNGANCDSGNPMGCWGPENASFEVVLCTECTDWVPPDVKNPSCDPGYVLDGDLCKFAGIPANPATICPSNWFLDPDGYCRPWAVLVDPECPGGFTYDPALQCCTATYIEPSGGWAGVPAREYSSCPVGYDYFNPPGVCVYPGQWVSGQNCKTFTAQLGDCRDTPPGGGCENPGQYGSQGPCESAGCKWVPGVVGAGGGSCTFP